ncbi:MAG: metalloregulator ArsR/SmtB family transcription factor [Vicinamibacterales bacterium]|nr:metalloregulator ArsR/SmtB family transcription factor [Vicinamibacterales bacterium]
MSKTRTLTLHPHRPPHAGDERSDHELAVLCKALGHPARVQLLRFLMQHEACFFGDLSEAVPLAASTVSQHLAILKEAGLVEGSADQQRVCYCVVPKRLAALKRLIAAL